MDEEQLRELATELREQLPTVITDELARDAVAVELDAALALHHGRATKALRVALSARQETRDWMLERVGEDDRDLDDDDRSVMVLPGLTAGLGLHYVCPQGDYDIYVESLADAPGRCPHDNSKMVRADD